jgi:hypothetical protein
MATAIIAVAKSIGDTCLVFFYPRKRRLLIH